MEQQPKPGGVARYRLTLNQSATGAALERAAVPAMQSPEPPEAAIEQQLQHTLEVLGAVRHAIADLEHRQRNSLDELQHVAIELSVAIAARVLRQQADAGQLGIEPLVEEVVNRFGHASAFQLALNPLDIADLQTVSEGDAPGTHGELPFVPDESLARGDCEIRCGGESYVSRMELILEEIRVDLVESLEDAQTERRLPAEAGSGLRRFPDRRQTA